MDFIKCSNLTYYYTSYENDNVVETKAVDNITLTVKRGEFVALLGHNGSGKSTLGKLITGLIKPDEGSVYVNNSNDINTIRRSIGIVFQNLDNQLVSSVVEEEVAFGCENLGMDSYEIRQRVDYALKKVCMYEYRTDLVSGLSGGQKQRIAIAGILAMKPQGIIFDEATAMLDPVGRKNVMSIAKELNREGITIIFITHYMEEAANADRIIVLNKGGIAMEGTPEEIFTNEAILNKNHINIPLITALANSLNIEKCFSAEKLAAELIKRDIKPFEYKYTEYKNTNKEILRLENASFTYTRGKRAVDNVSLSVKQCEIISVIGAAGSGKSTLIQLLNGIYKPEKGQIYFKGENINKIKGIKQKIGVVFQYPEDQIFEATVYDEVAFAPKNMKLSSYEISDRVKFALDFVNIPTEYYGKNPMQLSGGEKRRIAIAGILAMKPDILVMDEPLAGLDPDNKNQLVNNIKSLVKNNITVIITAHSMEDAAEISDRIAVMKEGRLIACDTPEAIFSDYENILSSGLEIPEITRVFHIINKEGIAFPYVCKLKDAEYILKRAVGK